MTHAPATVPATSRLAAALEAVAGRLERAEFLDKSASALATAVDRVLPRGRTRDLAAGVPIGHPVHPLLVAGPIGSWTAASMLDLTRQPRAARRLVGFGLLTAVPTAVSGLTDWLTTARGERRVGLVHATLNTVALLCYGASWQARRHGRNGRGAALSAAGLLTSSAAGWLGGHLTYAYGVGVDTTAFQAYPSEWTDIAAAADVPATGPLSAGADGVPILLARQGGAIVALAARCTHRGGPLVDGKIAAGCVTCPWHGSVFDLATGEVREGPATRPQPVLAVRIRAGRVEVRRADEPRALRTNPIGP